MITVNAKDFGLTDGAVELQHKKIQNAIDNCFKQGGGEVIIPKGKYRLGDIRLRSNVTLRLESGAYLMGSNDPEDYFNYLNDTVEPLDKSRITDAPYVHLNTIHGETEYNENDPNYRFRRLPGSRWNNALIRAIDAKNIKIIGERNSVIDGMNCFDAIGEEDYRGPHGICFYNCEGIELRGYTIRQTGNWAHWLLFSKNITMDNILVTEGHDGVDFFDCINATVTNCEFYTGDDCIAGFGNVNLYVSDCILNSSCSAMRFGGTNAYVERCRMYGPGKYCFRGSLTKKEKAASAPSALEGHRSNMLSIFTYYSDYSMPIPVTPGNIIIADCVFENADRFLHFNFSGNETWQRYRPLNSIEFRNITATDIRMPINLYGKEGEEVSLTLQNVDITLNEIMNEQSLIHAGHFKRVTLDNVNINGRLSCIVKKWSEGNIILNNVKCDAETTVKKADTNFFAHKV
jgi:hypothetical protein